MLEEPVVLNLGERPTELLAGRDLLSVEALKDPSQSGVPVIAEALGKAHKRRLVDLQLFGRPIDAKKM